MAKRKSEREREFLVEVDVTRRIEVIVKARNEQRAFEKADTMNWEEEVGLAETTDWHAIRGSVKENL